MLSRLRLESEGSPGRARLWSNLISAQLGSCDPIRPSAPSWFPWVEVAGDRQMADGRGVWFDAGD